MSATALYWGVQVTTTHGNGSFVGFAEVVGRETPGGADAFTGGTGSAQSQFDATTNKATNAYDKNASTKWIAGTAVPVRTQYQLPSAKSINEFALTNRNDVLSNGAGLAFNFQSSPDGVTWTTEWSATTPNTWALGETRVFTNPSYVPPRVGSVTATQASNTLTATAKLALKGSTTATQASNTLTATATLKISGSTTATQASNTITATGVLTSIGGTGTVTATQASDVLTATAKLSIKGTTTVTQASNTLTATAKLSIKGTTTATQASNTLTATAVLSLKAAVTATQQDNVLTATAVLTALPVLGSVTAFQSSDAVYSSGIHIIISPPDPPKFRKRGSPINAYKQFKTLRQFRSR
jgi:hypothetical protein